MNKLQRKTTFSKINSLKNIWIFLNSINIDIF
jgi:hypothetical protein